jgi:hypothetical protein
MKPMQRTSRGMLFGLAVAACACGEAGVRPPPDAAAPADAEVPCGEPACNANAQTGCNAGEKCTWIIVAEEPEVLGVIGCVADGTVAEGGACERGAAGQTTGFDDCVAGTYCLDGTCQNTCSTLDSSDLCEEGFACGGVDSAYANEGQDRLTGFCVPMCDPVTQHAPSDAEGQFCGAGLDENDEQLRGCYGFWSSDASPSTFTCGDVLNPAFGHGTNLTEALGNDNLVRNACAGGNTFGGFYTSATDGDVVCIAFCRPGDTYEGFEDNVHGLAGDPHSLPALGIDDPAEECRYLYTFEDEDTPVTDVSYAVGVAYNISLFGTSDGETFYPAESCTTATLEDLRGGGVFGDEPNGTPDAVDRGCVNPANLLLGTPARRARAGGRSLGNTAELQAAGRAWLAAHP